MTRTASASGRSTPNDSPIGLVSDAVEGSSPAMRRVQTLIRRIAPTDRPVLLLGPTGCGKEVIAQQIHLHGLHSRSPFTDINCSSIPESLMEAELFGHERGSFTGAVTSRPGYLAQVSDGTLFLDEIGDLPLSLQPKLLRVLETRQFRAVGSGVTIAFRGRIVAATHRDLLQMVRDGRFREDLYYRLNVFTVEIPGLDQRREDIPALAQFFASRQSRALHFQDDALHLMAQAPWPGNVRQLRNVVDRIAVLSDGECIDAAAVAPFLAGSPLQAPESFEEIADRLLEMGGGDKISAIEHLLVDRALRSCEGNKTAAARMLGVNRKVVERRVQSHTERIHDARQQTAEARQLMEASAYSRAAVKLGAALDTLRSLPPLPDERQVRFEVLSELAVCKRSQDGWLSGEALGIYAEALRVGRGLVEPQKLNTLMFGSWSANLMRLELNQAHVLAEEIRLRGIEANDVKLQIDGCIAVANTRFWLAEFDGTLKMIDELRSLPGFGVTPVLRQGMTPAALAAMVEALAAYQQGDRPRVQRACDELRSLSATLEHAFSLAIVLQGCAWTECLLGNLDEAGQWAERLLDLSSVQGFVFYHGVAQIFAGYAISASRPAEAERMMRSGFDDEMAAQGGLLFHSFYSLLLSRHYLENRQPDRAEAQAQKAIQICIARRELAYLADLLCVRGKALAAMGDLEASAGEVHNAAATALALGCMPAREEALAALAATSLSTERP